MHVIYPEKLKKGDEIRIITPSRSMAIIGEESRKIANERFEKLGLNLSFGKNIEEKDDFASSSIKSRLDDLHDAFSDKNVKAVLTVIGGFNSNQLLKYIDWQLIKSNPKIFCGFSDITALNNAIFAKTGLVSYSGPHYSSFGQKLYFDYTLDYFEKCLLSDLAFAIGPSDKWSDDAWYIDQDNRKLINNEGYWIFNEGNTSGTILGANICTFNLLQGTEFMPDFTESVLFLEDDEESNPYHFDRDLQSVIHLPDFKKVKGLVIGRFQNKSGMTKDLLYKIIRSKKELNNIPVIANADFGHTDPKITFPIGGQVSLEIGEKECNISITKH